MKGLLSNLLFIVFVAVATISSTANVKGGVIELLRYLFMMSGSRISFGQSESAR